MNQQRTLLVAMLVAVSLVAIALLLDEQSEFEAAVQMLKDEQVTLATAVGADFETRLSRLEQAGEEVRLDGGNVRTRLGQLLGGALQLEKPRSRLLLVARPEDGLLLRTDGRAVSSPTLLSAARSGVSGLILPRDESAAFGLPPRIAVAGVETIEGRNGTWALIVLVSGERLRARERYAQLRFLLGLGGVTAIILGFGGAALRQQRRKLDVARALETASFEREREKLLAKADKMATLAALGSGIAHEVATPLSTIMARVEQLLPANQGDPRASAALNVVLAQVERIQAIIRGVLGLARGELPPLVHARPDVIADNAAALSRHRLAQAGVELVLQVPKDLPDVACDPPLLEQALTNLLLNACDASTRGATVLFSAHQEEGALCFCVLDEGDGISAEAAARAQEPFFTTKPKGYGNGLGLAITREVVAHHRGELRLEPRTSARGTRATIELPHA